MKIKGVLTVMVGLPGSGKSTWANENGGAAVIICPDEIRAEVNGDAADQSNAELVWETAYNRAEYFLEIGKNVIFDSTAVTRRARRQILKRLRPHSRAVIAVYLYTNPAICRARNAARERVVPAEVIDKMEAKLQPPHASEGFDWVKYI